MKKILLSAIVLAICVIAPAAAAERVVHFAHQAIPVSFSHDRMGLPEAIGLSQVYDTLLRRDFDVNLKPNLAESWEISEDGMVYTFHLRKDVQWSDGVGFTAKDVEFTVDRKMKSPAFSWLYAVNVERMEVPDDYTFKLYLKKPNVLFIAQLSDNNIASIMPKHGFEKYGEEYGTSVDKIIGTGPYIVTEWQPEVSVTYKANENHFKGAPDIKNIVYHRITDTSAAVVAIQTGELDILLSPLNGAAFRTLEANKDVVVNDYISTRFEAIYMYCKDGIFSDVRMRRAVAHAVNKEDVLMVAVDGLGQTLRYPGDIGPTVKANPDNFTPAITYEYDVEKARALVKEAGKEGAPVVVKSYNTDPYAPVATYLQGVLNEIGLQATVEPMERSTFLTELNQETCTILPLGWNGNCYDMEESLGMLLHSANVGTASNYSFYINPEMDALVEAARGTFDMDARKELYKKIINKLMEDIPFISTYALRSAVIYRPDITTDNARSYQLFDYHWVK